MSNKSIADRVAEHGLTLVDFAKLLGVSRATMYRWDRDYATLSARKIAKIEGEIAYLRRRRAQSRRRGLEG